jgi:hypothetical protein
MCLAKFAKCFYMTPNRISEKDLDAIKGKHMVETRQQLLAGIKSGAFQENDAVCISSTCYRICAPTTTENTISCVLWTKDNNLDNSPTQEKVVSFIKNLHASSKIIWSLVVLCTTSPRDVNYLTLIGNILKMRFLVMFEQYCIEFFYSFYLILINNTEIIPRYHEERE